MKRTFAIAAVALTALTGAASAMTDASSQVILERYAPNVDVSALTDAQINSLLAIVNSGDSASDKRGKIQTFVN